MEFSDRFRERLLEELIRNKPFLRNNSLALLSETSETCYRVIASQISTQFSPYRLDYQSAADYIIDTISVHHNPRLQLRRLCDHKFLNNEICFELPFQEFPEWGSPAQIEYTVMRENLEFECEDEFWKLPQKVSAYQKISSFDCFIDFKDNMTNYHKLKNWAYLYNSEAWLGYIFELATSQFPNFGYSIKYSSSKMKRFLKKLTNEVFFGFEYDEKLLKADFRKGEPALPAYFNLVVINSNFKKPTSAKEYVLKCQPDIISLGILGNPFFFSPCFPLSNYRSVLMYHDPEKPMSWNLKYKREVVDHKDGTFEVVHPKEYGERLKKHAFFYMDTLSYSARSYLIYVEQSIMNSLQD